MTISFWVVAALLLVWAALLSESDNLVKSVFGSFIIIGLITWGAQYLYGFWNAVGLFVAANPIVAALLIIGYFIIGAAYVAFWRYGSFIEDHADNIKTMFGDFRSAIRRDESRDNRYGNGVQTEVMSETEIQEKFLEDYNYVRKYGPMGNKARITNWIIWWPLSGLYHLTYRPVRAITDKLYKIITNRLVSVFKSSGSRIVKG